MKKKFQFVCWFFSNYESSRNYLEIWNFQKFKASVKSKIKEEKLKWMKLLRLEKSAVFNVWCISWHSKILSFLWFSPKTMATSFLAQRKSKIDLSYFNFTSLVHEPSYKSEKTKKLSIFLKNNMNRLVTFQFSKNILE